MLIKIANSEFVLDQAHEVTAEKALSSPEITERFKKIASEIKKVAPKSGDFLYFIARGIHAMEHAAIDPVSRTYRPEIGHIAVAGSDGRCVTCGTPVLKTASGQVISGLWCKSSQVEPWINQNGDAFPESELLAEIPDPQDHTRTIKAYQTFIGKGLFTDHKSSEVENIRGIILDAEYDHHSKGVDLLIALDKINYPELARQVSAGYSAQVSMGTQVNFSLCNICGNKAVTENDYCNHVRQGKALVQAGKEKCYEINSGLNFIEISMVGNAADPRARIKTIVAHTKDIKKRIEANLDSKSAETENQLILESINRLETQINDLQSQVHEGEPEVESEKFSATEEILNKIASLEKQINEIGGRFMAQKTQNKKAYMQGTVEPEVGKPFEMADKNYMQYWDQDIAQTGQDQTNGPEGLHGGYGLGSDEEVKKMYLRANQEQRRQARKALLEKVSYMQGTVEPELGKPFEMADKNYMQYWDDDIKQTGPDQTNGPEGLHGGYGMGSDEEVKKMLLRAKLRAKLEKSANPAKNKWTVFAGDEPILSVVAEEAYGSDLDAVATEVDSDLTNEQWFNSKPYGVNLIQAVKTLGIEKVASQIEKAKVVTAQLAEPQAAPAPEMEAAPAPEMGMEGEMAPEAAPAPEGLSAAEGIRAAAERIESAKDEILSLVDELDGEPALEGEALGDEMSAAGEELGELGAEMGAAEQLPPAAASAYKRLVRTALKSADKVLRKAENFVVKHAEEDKDKDGIDDAKEEKHLSDDQQHLPDHLQKAIVDKKEASRLAKLLAKFAEEDKEDDKKDDDKGVEIEVKDKDKDGVDKDDVDVKEATLKRRKAERIALAQQLYNLTEGDMIAEAHPEGGNTTTFPNQEEGRIETETEAQEKDEEVANSIPRGELVARHNSRLRLVKAAERLVKADAAEIAQKATEAEDAEEVANKKKKELADATSHEKTAEVDSETKQYYSELASESATGTSSDSETKSFYNELTSDFGKSQATAATHDYGLKMKRAFNVSMKKAHLGQIESTHEAIEADVDRLMKLDDESFAAIADVVANTKKVPNLAVAKSTAKKQTRTAGAINVGVDQTSTSTSIKDQLSNLPWKRS